MADGEGLGTASLEIRRLQRSDLPFVLDVRNECRDMLHDNRAFTLEESEAWFAQSRPDFRLVLLAGVPIGYLRLSNHDREARSAYVGADLHLKFRGKGLGRAVFDRFLPVLAAELDIRTWKLEVLSHNERALHLYLALGFKETGRRLNVGVREGRSVDSIGMALDLR